MQWFTALFLIGPQLSGDSFCKTCGAPVLKARKDAWEIDRGDIVISTRIGEGNFGEVCLGTLGGSTTVAIKTCKKSMKASGFLAEAIKMKRLVHPHIVKLHGVCTVGDPLMIVMEYLSDGCLLDFLRSRRGRNLPLNQLTQVLADVCCGMAFLQGEHWIHADLAARNLLVGAEQAVKIADFGHAMRTNEANDKIDFKHLMPLRWAAPGVW